MHREYCTDCNEKFTFICTRVYIHTHTRVLYIYDSFFAQRAREVVSSLIAFFSIAFYFVLLTDVSRSVDRVDSTERTRAKSVQTGGHCDHQPRNMHAVAQLRRNVPWPPRREMTLPGPQARASCRLSPRDLRRRSIDPISENRERNRDEGE